MQLARPEYQLEEKMKVKFEGGWELVTRPLRRHQDQGTSL